MKEILRYAFFFNMYQRLIGCKKYLKKYADTFVQLKEGQSILEIGCATGNIIEFFPKNIDYTGIDYSQNYIDYSKRKYPRYNFICQNAAEDFSFGKKYDVVLCEAVIVCLTDNEVEKVFNNIKNHVHKNSRIIISDLNYSKTNTFWQNFFLSHERGKNLRDEENYRKLISKFFKINKVTILNNIYRIPYSRAVFECSPIL